MSINRKLGDLANVLDDGTEGQVLSFNASGAIAAADIAAGASVYDSAELLPLTGLSAGDMAYVTGTNRFYISNGTGWYSVSLVNTNPSISSVQDSDGGTTPFTLTTDGTATVITVTASDPEDVPVSYSYSVTAGSLTNGGGTTATVSQADNVFTVTPSTTEAYAGTFELTFTASDGINTDTSANSFTLNFISTITNSKYTTLLVTADGASDNNNITDASTNNHTITVNGDAHAGTFSPYRSGGYSTYFDGTGDNLDISASSDFDFGTGDFTFEMSFYAEANTGTWQYLVTNRASGWGAGVFRFMVDAAAGTVYCTIVAGATYDLGGYDIVPKTWNHISAVKSGDTITLYLNGATPTPAGGWYQSYSGVNNVSMGSSSKDVDVGSAGTSDYFKGYIRDLRIVKGTAITPPSGGPTERLEAVTNTSLLTCHLPYIADGSTNDHSITVNSDVTTKPFSPYDYTEYSTTDHGGSVHFAGTADKFNASGSSDYAPSTDEFTIKLWYYPKVESSGVTYLVRQGTGTSNVGYWAIAHYSSGRIRRMQNVGGSFNGQYSANDVIKIGQWNYIEFYQNGANTGEIKVNGSSVITGANYIGNTDNLHFGNSVATDADLYISDIQIVKGSDGRESSVPTAPMSTNTNAKLHIKGTDASIIDKAQSGNLTLIGDTTGSTAQAKFSNTKSMYFDGTGDYITTENNSNLNLGTGALTVELWYYLTTSQNHTLFELHDGYPNGGGAAYDNNRAKMVITSTKILLNDGTANVGDYAETQVINQWRHWAWSRDASGNNRFYLNGTQIGTTTSSSNNLITPVVDLGRRAENDSTYMQGYIQDFRITKGLARYTANFTPPTASLEG